MSALGILAELRQAGVELTVADGRLKVRAGKGRLTPELQARLTAHKAQILELLQAARTPGPVPVFGEVYDAPLSFAQEKLLFLSEYSPESPFYNMALSCHVQGVVERPLLQDALNRLVERHAALRTTFLREDKANVQRIVPVAACPLEFLDLSDSTTEDIQACLQERAAQPFDLATAPLLRACLLQESDQSFHMLLVAHHIVFDFRSAELCFTELFDLYNGVALAALPLQFADYAQWQREQLGQARTDRLLEYWTTQLRDAPPSIDLPFSKPRPAEFSHRGGWVARRMEAKQLAALNKLATEAAATPFMLVFAAFSLFLTRLTGEDELVIGVPVDGRNFAALENLVGFFLNTLAIRCDLSPQRSFRQSLAATREILHAAYLHQDLPFEQLVQALQPERDISRTPIFQVMCAWRDEPPRAARNFEKFTVAAPQLVGQATAKFDLTLSVAHHDNELELGFEYCSDLFAADTAERLLDRFAMLLDDALVRPDADIATLRLLSDLERTVIAEGFNATTAVHDVVDLHAMVEAQAERTPSAIALEFAGGAHSYAELNSRANQLARHLVATGVQHGCRVGVLTERGPHFPLALLAVLKAGGAYVPLDPAFPDLRLHYMLADSAPTVVLTQGSLISRLEGSAAPLCNLDEFDFASGSAANLDEPKRLTDPAYVIYTSGSTGKPKGTALSHGGLANLLHWQMRQPRLDRAARTLHYASLCFDVSFTEIFSTWAAGGTLVTVDADMRRDFPELLRFIRAQNIERVFLPCAALQPFAEAVNEADLHAALPLTFSDVIVSGEQLRITPAIRHMFSAHPELRLHNHYGPAETHVVTALTLPANPDDWESNVSIGKPIDNTQIYVLDKHQQVVPIGVTGELYIGGVQVGLGYHGREDLTAGKFLTDWFNDEPGARLYRSGDMARFRPDGSLDFIGRIDDQLKLRGYRIEPGEIEATLDEHPAVQCAVVAVRPATADCDSRHLVAWVVPAADSTIEIPTLRRHMQEQLPEYMVPSAFIVLESLPLTPSGKIDRRRLPDPDINTQLSPYVAPRNPLEELLCEQFSLILGAERIGVHDNFFHAGGHSLSAMQLASRIRDALQLSLPLKYLFRFPTPELLAATITTIQGAMHTPPAAPAPGTRDDYVI